MIKSLITKHVSKAFDNQLSDAVSAFSVVRKGVEGAYDPVNDSYAPAIDVVISSRGVFDAYTANEIANTQIDITDLKLTCLQDEFNGIPQNDDVLFRDEQDGRIISFEQDAAGATWIMQVRGIR
jgi:hypothetical protein